MNDGILTKQKAYDLTSAKTDIQLKDVYKAIYDRAQKGLSHYTFFGNFTWPEHLRLKALGYSVSSWPLDSVPKVYRLERRTTISWQ
jgi:hypothetical protein